MRRFNLNLYPAKPQSCVLEAHKAGNRYQSPVKTLVNTLNQTV